MKNNFMTAVSRTFNNLGFQMKKHSPEILVVAGVVGVVTSAVMACKATTKLNEILEESKTEIDKINTYSQDKEIVEKHNYTEGLVQRDLAVTYIQTGMKIAKLYAPSVILGTLSITSILASNNILRKRNVALAAAYATVDKGFKEYRSRVVERFGEEVDRQLKYDIKAKEIEETVTNENGEEETVTKTVNVFNASNISEYARLFNSTNPNYRNDSDYNEFFLKGVQRFVNEQLKVKKRIFLNEVYEQLGFEKTRAGQIVGWVYDEANDEGDNYIDFGINEVFTEDGVTGACERNILIEFNVDGDVWTTM